MRHHLLTLTLLTSLLAACGGQQDAPRVAAPTTQQGAAAPTAAAMPQAATAAETAASASAPAVMAATAPNLPLDAPTFSASAPALSASAPTSVTTHNVPYAKPFVIQADLTFRTPDVRKTAVAIEKLANQHGGFVVSNQTTSEVVNRRDFEQADGMLLRLENYISSTDLVVRIPRQNTQAFLHSIQPHITWLERQNFSADNVNVQFQRQILTAQREQQHAKELQQLNQYNRGTPEERRATIAAQYQAREQEDEMKVQQIELQDKIQYATINLHFNQSEQIAKTVTPNPERVAAEYRPSIWASMKQAMISSWNHLFAIMLFLLKIWYLWATALVIWWWKRARKAQAQDSEYVATNDWDVPEAAPTEPVQPSRRRRKFRKNDDE